MTLPTRYPVLFNPKARGHRGALAMRFLMRNATRMALYATASEHDATLLTEKFVAQGEPIVVAAGGDGTINAVVRGLARSSTSLGVLPVGTMNVFARELHIPVDDLQAAFDLIVAGHLAYVDLFEANGHPFVQMAGVGFDAAVIEETTWESKKMLGPLAYLLAAVKVLGNDPPKIMVRTGAGETLEGVAVLLGNGALYGGRIKLFHRASNRDHMLDVLVFTQAGYKLVLDSLRGIALGNIDFDDSTVSYIQADSVTVRANREVPLQVDGELIGRATEVVFGRKDNAFLPVCAPERTERPDTILKTLFDSLKTGR